MRARGITLNTTCWRTLDGSYIAGFDASLLKDVDGDVRTACLPLQELDALMLERFVQRGGSVEWRTRVVGTGQDEKKAWVDVETGKGKERLEADYIVGCDGAQSAVRRCLLGEKNFPGSTWGQQIVATNVCTSLSSL